MVAPEQEGDGKDRKSRRGSSSSGKRRKSSSERRPSSSSKKGGSSSSSSRRRRRTTSSSSSSSRRRESSRRLSSAGGDGAMPAIQEGREGEEEEEEEHEEDLGTAAGEKGPAQTIDAARGVVYRRMLMRAGYSETLVDKMWDLQHKRGSYLVHLGAKSGQYYRDMFERRTFDEFYRLEVPKKSRLEKMHVEARALLTMEPHSGDEDEPEGEEGQGGGGGGGGGGGTSSKPGGEDPGKRKPSVGEGHRKKMLRSSRFQIGYKPDTHGPPGWEAPIQQLPNSEGREKYFSYEGDWEEGKMTGYGRFKYVDGSEYAGAFQADWPDGYGETAYPDGTKFKGSFKAGFFHGHGKLTSKTGSVYEGGWSDGVRQGHGKLVFPSKSYYEGDFLAGVPHGRGMFVSKNLKLSYDGSWDRGYIYGNGTLKMPNGDRDVRSWPRLSKWGGGLSVRGAVELIEDEKLEKHREKLESREFIYGVSIMVDLRNQVWDVRTKLQQSRSADKEEQLKLKKAKRREAKEKLRLLKQEAVLKVLDGPTDKEKALNSDFKV